MTHLGPSLRRTKVRERPGRRALAAAVLSLALNGIGLFLLARAGAFQPPHARTVSPVALAPIDARQWAANRAIVGQRAEPSTTPAPPPQMKPPEPEPQRDVKGQVVDVAPSKDSTPPKSSRFLAERDSSVEKETRSRHAKPGYERVLPTPSAPGVSAAPAPGEEGASSRSAPGREGTPAQPRPKAEQPKVALAPDAHGDLPGGHAGTARQALPPPVPGQGEGGERRSGEPGENKLITPGTLARVTGGPAPDRLEGVEEGEGTFLNTVGWKYATYFNRIKQAVAASWDPLGPLDARDPDRSTYGTNDRFTLLGVTLDDTGHLKSLVVEQTSGIEFLDRSAMTAFRKAEPFVNPPHGIVDSHGEIKFSFGFFLEVGRPGLRIYRAPMP